MPSRTRPIPVQQPYTVISVPRRNGFAIASLIAAVVGIVVGVVPLFIGLVLSFVPAVLGLVLGAVGIVRAPSRGSGLGLAVAGVVVAVLTMVLWAHGYGVLW